MDDLEKRLFEFAQKNNNFDGDDILAILQRVERLRKELNKLAKERDDWKGSQNLLLERYVAVCEALGIKVREEDEYYIPDGDFVVSEILRLKGECDG